jgi:hypothetical protein
MGPSPIAGKVRPRAVLALALGLVLTLAYFAWLYSEPRGDFEFAYAPFTPEPLPYSAMRGFTYEQLWGHVARFCLLGPGLLLLSYGLHAFCPIGLAVPGRRALLWAGAAALCVSAFVMLAVLRGRAISDDELVYRMQATFLAEGRLSGLDIGITPPDYFSIPTRAGYTGKYLPGEPLFQVPGLWLGIPAFSHLPLLALTLFAWYRALRLRTGPKVAAWSTLALAGSPMVLLTSATGLTQTLSLCCTVLLGLGFEWARSGRPLAGSVLAAFAVSLGLLTRVQAMVPVGAVFVPALAYTLLRARHFGALAALAGGIAAGLLLLGAYNYALSGSPFTLPWYLQCAIEKYGFGRVWKYDAYEHTPLRGLENLAVVLVRLNAWWVGFPCSLALFGLWLWLGRPLERAGIWLWMGLAVIAFEFAYYSPGASDTGAIYHYELILPASLVAGAVVNELLQRAPTLAGTALLVHAALGTLGFIAEQTFRLERLVGFIHRDSDAALARIPAPALLFHAWHAGEVQVTGWVFDSFPRRFRGQDDAIVTFPWLPAAYRARIAERYPGRSCWYYRRNPDDGSPELHRCESAGALLDPAERASNRTLWVRPTAYSKTSYDPVGANIGRRLRDAQGRRIVTCCALRNAEKLGAKIDHSYPCVKDGP